jgi:polyhydroxyalkanoate synthesis regulator phasin
MAKAKTAAKAPKEFKPTEALRQGWLAYLGVYGLAFERAKPAVANLGEKYAEFFGDLVNKGEELESVAKDQIVDAGERAKGIYGAGFEKARNVLPFKKASDVRVKELEAEVESLTKKVASLTKKPATRTKRAKAA